MKKNATLNYQAGKAVGYDQGFEDGQLVEYKRTIDWYDTEIAPIIARPKET